MEKSRQSGPRTGADRPAESDLRAPERLAIDYANAAELADKAGKALKALAANQPAMWKALRAQGIFRGHGPAPKVAFLYTGQGSQYVNMLQPLRATEPIVAETFAEADRVMTPLLGKPLSEFIFVDQADAERRRQGRRRSAPDCDYSTRRAGNRSGADPAAGRLRHRARLHDGTQPGRIRSAGRGRRPALCGCARSRQRSRPRNDQRGDGRQRPHGRRVCAARKKSSAS